MEKKEINLDYTQKGNDDLFDTVAKVWATKVEESECKIKKKKKGKIVEEIVNMKTKKNQLRNFYDKVLELENRAKHEDWESILPFVKMLNSKVAYAEHREVVNCEFAKMMTQCISQVKTKEDLTNFKLFFEAVLGFFKGGN